MRVLAATDRSATAERAVAWAGELAARYEAELVLLQVLAPDADAAAAERSLSTLARQLAGERGRAAVRAADDPPQAIVEAAEAEGADVLVVGNAGMRGRKQFLLGNVPNRISHAARCTVVIVNTTDGARPVPPGDGEDARERPLLGRAAQIARVIGTLRLGARDAPDRERAQRLRAALDELGPTFAKLGQILSTRPDLLPPAFTEELASLQDRVTPLTEAEVVAVMEQELRVPWEDVFASIDPVPLAAGTIGQVHRAVLESGDRVVVKVQRPTAGAEIMRDLDLLELFAEQAAGRPGLRGVIDIPALVEHLASSLRRELDFRAEAANLERMRAVLEPYDRLAVPALHAELSTARLLVMEEVGGVPVRDAPDTPARREAARQLLEAFYRQVLTEGFFHADPHPGNLRWWQDRVWFLDLGMVGEVAPELRPQLVVLLLAFWREDPAMLAEVLTALAGEAPPRTLDSAALEAELADFIGRFRGGSLREIRLGPMLEGMTEIAARHGIRLPAALALSGKAFGQMQLALTELDPELDPFAVISAFLLRGVRERVLAQADPERLFYEGQKLRLRLGRLLDAVERAAGARPGASLQVEVVGTEGIETAIDRAGRRLALAGLAGAAVVAALLSGRAAGVAAGGRARGRGRPSGRAAGRAR